MLERRAKRGDDIPHWYENKANVLEVEFLEYLAGAEPSKGVKARLETLGSYEATKAIENLESIEEMVA